MINKTQITLGSLFDGSGGFPLASAMCGITPVWASEIEKFPIEVTTKRFPDMKHLGDIRKINGAEITPVDIITFGSPCQDLSVAGSQKGLSGERSGLFLEAIRIIKEMRKKTNGIYPTFAIWENVPGAFSSNGGEDFRTVLEKFCEIGSLGGGGETHTIPRPPKKKWTTCGSIMGNGFSIAWRVLDAQFWGVPQRRRRIFLVADFGGQRSCEILFKRKGLSRNFTESLKAWERLASAPESGVRVPKQTEEREINLIHCDSKPKTLKIRCGCDGGGKGALIQEDKSATLSCNNDQILFIPPPVSLRSSNIILNDQGGSVIGVSENVTSTLRAENHGNVSCVVQETLHFNTSEKSQSDSLNIKCYGVCSQSSNSMKSNNPNSGFYESDTSKTLDCNGVNPACNQGGICVVSQRGCDCDTVEKTSVSSDTSTISKMWLWAVRRLMPIECCRLQGFPDWWCSDVPHKDTPEYKMWGNGVALPCVLYIMEGITDVLSNVNQL